MKAIEMLKEDHREVLNLIGELEAAEFESDEFDIPDTNVFNQLHHALKLHTQMEEEIFYPEMEKFEETSEQVRRAYREHDQIDNLLAQLSLLLPYEEPFHELLAELRSSIEHHIEDEEGELFTRAEELCDLQKLEEMGQEMETIKNNARATVVTQ
ncbi:MAG: hemerythrin domain-containing protein [Acidobacteria bacterium]|nr:hemerythrin domain-containing protein [Acidobacteriota bacterium]